MLYYKYKVAKPDFCGYLIGLYIKKWKLKNKFRMYEVNQDYINFQKEVLLINLVFIKLWLHINDSTPKRNKYTLNIPACYDYILMIAHQNGYIYLSKHKNVMITY